MKNKNSASSGISHNALALGTVINGDIKAEEDLRIDGKVEGKIECSGRVVIGPDAEIIGDIYCVNADIIGKVNGKLIIKETLSLWKTGVFIGELIAGSLEIEPGAVFNGSCKME